MQTILYFSKCNSKICVRIVCSPKNMFLSRSRKQYRLKPLNLLIERWTFLKIQLLLQEKKKKKHYSFFQKCKKISVILDHFKVKINIYFFKKKMVCIIFIMAQIYLKIFPLILSMFITTAKDIHIPL